MRRVYCHLLLVSRFVQKKKKERKEKKRKRKKNDFVSSLGSGSEELEEYDEAPHYDEDVCSSSSAENDTSASESSYLEDDFVVNDDDMYQVKEGPKRTLVEENEGLVLPTRPRQRAQFRRHPPWDKGKRAIRGNIDMDVELSAFDYNEEVGCPMVRPKKTRCADHHLQ